jgi:hypothetical protein
MSNQKYFDVPWATGGDQTVIPDPLQVGGTVSFTEGWNFNYQRDLSTDPAALPIDRSTMNYLINTITTALQALQKETVPEFILASQNGGVAISYGLGSVVLWSASGNAPFQKFVSIVANNVATPSASDPLGATTGWQIVCDPIATSAQAAAGTNNAAIMTPLLVAQQTALRALLAGSATQVFNVGPATSATQAPQLQQLQQQAATAFATAGTAPAFTLAASPAVTSLTANLRFRVKFGAAGTTGSNTLNVNGLGAVALKQFGPNGALAAGVVYNGLLTDVEYDGTEWVILDPIPTGTLINVQILPAGSGTYNATPGTNSIILEGSAGGGGSGGNAATNSTTSTLSQPGSAGAYVKARFTSGFTGGIPYVAGAAGNGGAAGANNGTAGGASTFGTSGALALLPGGIPGAAGGGATGTSPVVVLPAAATAAPTITGAAEIMSALSGESGTFGVCAQPTASNFAAGRGGRSPLGQTSLSGYGSGGNAIGTGVSSAATAGIAGLPGVWIVYEYA